MSNCPPMEQLSAYLEGTLPEWDLPTVEAHVRTCLLCDGLLSDLKSHPQSVVRQALVSHQNGTPAAVIVAPNDALVASANLPPTQFGPYQLIAKLGQGGMGTVYKARHTTLDRIEAVKVLPHELLQHPQAVERFKREMRAVAKLDHPHIVRAHHAGEEGGQYYLVMEFVDGRDVGSLLKEYGRLSVPNACEIVRQAADGLQHAYEHGLVHRDIKPSNLIVSQKGVVKILDLGLALVGSEAGVPDGELTSTDQIMGTLDYMAPEQAGNAHQVDIRADLYSLGATLYHLLTGQTPFGGRRYAKVLQKLHALATESPRSAAELRGDLPADLVALLQRLLAKQPPDRCAIPAEVVDALRPYATGSNLATLLHKPAQPNQAQVLPGASTLDFSAFPQGGTDRDLMRPPSVPVPGLNLAMPNSPQLPVQEKSPRVKKRRSLVKLIAAMVFVLLLGAVVIRVTTDRGELIITSSDPDVKVHITKSGNSVDEWTLKQGTNTFTLWSGEYKVELAGKYDGLTVKGSTVTLTRGDTRQVHIERIPNSVAADAYPGEKPVDPKSPEKTRVPPIPREMQSLQAKAALSNRYRLTVIEALPDYPVWCQPVDIAENGDILGTCATSKTSCVFVRSNGVMRELDLPKDRYAYPKRITSRGQVFGTLTTKTKPYHSMPFVVENGQLRLMEQKLNTRLNGANQAGVGVGTRGPTETSGEFAVLLQDGKVNDLQLPQSASESRAFAINNRGQVAIDFFAVRNGKKDWWSGIVDGQQVVEFGTFAGTNETNASDINDAGDVIGTAKGIDDDGREREQPFLFRNGKLVEIPVLSGFNQASALRINSNGQVVGYAFQRNGGQHAFLFQRGRLYDLNPDGWMYSKATAINATGQIVGEGKRAGQDKTVGFLLDPISEKTSTSIADQSLAALPARVISPSTGMQFVLIPPGTFRMGSTKNDALRYAANSRFDDTTAEQPQHFVNISKPFYLGTYEVTQDEYQRVMGVNPSHFAKLPDKMENVEGQETNRFPVEMVSWFDAVEFCNKLSQRDNLPEAYQLKVTERRRGTIVEADVKLTDADGYRLPTEAEWEYACRANTTKAFHFGEELNGHHANIDGTHPFGTKVAGPSLSQTSDVGLYKPNAFGLHDMHGNVSEWCQDMSDIAVYSTRDNLTVDPLVSSSTNSTARIERGGYWGCWAVSGRSACRQWNVPSYQNRALGFRVARGRIGSLMSIMPVPSAPQQIQSTATNKQTAIGFAGTQAGAERDDNKLKMKFCWCPDGRFQMGSPTNEDERAPNEDQIDVEMSGFWMSKYEVTQGEWQSVMESTPSEFPGERMPVNNVSWDDANAFVEKLTIVERSAGKLQNDWSYRLPSEAQWEYACRAGTTSPFAFGNSLTMEQANFPGQLSAAGKMTGLNRPVDVGSYQPNRWGLCDMHGNVAEWCRNAWEPSLVNGLGSEATVGIHSRIRRGGAFNQLRTCQRSAYRDSAPHETKRAFIGFRVVLERTTKPVAALTTNLAPSTTSVPPKRDRPSATNAKASGKVWHGWPANAPPPAVAPFDADQARRHQDAWATYLGEPSRNKKNSIGMELALIPPGTFTMGSPAAERWRKPDEGPVDVTLTSPYWLGTCEVTQAEWEEVMRDGISAKYPESLRSMVGPQFPVSFISWHDAGEFCKRLTDRERRADQLSKDWEYALPTEAQWEFACRAGTTTTYNCGNDEKLLPEFAWFASTSNNHAVAVRGYRSNSFGLYDMLGNVTEYCRDSYGNSLPGGINPLVPIGPNSSQCVQRGNFWGGHSNACRSAFRSMGGINALGGSTGFRIACISTREVLSDNARSASATTVERDPPMVVPLPARSNYVGVVPGEERDDNGLKLKFCWCPEGEFLMGRRKGESSQDPVEDPVQVQLSGFWLGKYEVTQRDWVQMMKTTPWSGKEAVREGGSYPATLVSWTDADEFCRKLTESERKSGRLRANEKYSLPTEAQWEYGCRAGSTAAYTFGADPKRLGEFAWYRDNAGNNGEAYPHPVGLKLANAWGLHDMHGNVWEWCHDWDSRKLPGGRDPAITERVDVPWRTLRGGCFENYSQNCVSGWRAGNDPESRENIKGFRVALVRVSADAKASSTTPPTRPDNPKTPVTGGISVGKPLLKPVPVTLNLKPEPVELPVNSALSPSAWVTRPATIPGVVSWTIQLRRPLGEERDLQFNPDGTQFATAGADRTVRIWDRSAGRVVSALVGPTVAGDAPILSVSWSACGRFIAVTHSDQGVRVWQVATGQPVAWVPAPVRMARWSPDNRYVALAEIHKVILWDALEQRVAKEFVLPDTVGQLVTVAWSPEGTQLVAASRQAGIWLCDMATGSATRFKASESIPNLGALAWSPDGQLIAACSEQRIGYLFRAADGTKLDSFPVKGFPPDVDWSPDGRSVCFPESIIRDVKSGSMRDAPGYRIGGAARAWSPDGEAIYETGQNGLTARLDLRLAKMDILTDLNHNTCEPVWSPDGGVLGVHHGRAGSGPLYVWGGDPQQLAKTFDRTMGKITWVPPGRTLAIGKVVESPQGFVEFLNTETGKISQTLTLPKVWSFQRAASPNGDLLATLNSDHVLRIWNVQTQALLRELPLPNERPTNYELSFSPDGKWLAFSGYKNSDSYLWIWNTSDWSVVEKVWKDSSLWGAVWSPDSREFVGDGRIVTLPQGTERPDPDKSGRLQAWTKGGTRISTTNERWVIKTGGKQQAIEFRPDGFRPIHFSVSPDERYLATGDPNGIGMIWDLKSCELLLSFLLIPEKHRPLAINPEGHYRSDTDVSDILVYVVQTADGQHTLTPAEFEMQYGWKNDPTAVVFPNGKP